MIRKFCLLLLVVLNSGCMLDRDVNPEVEWMPNKKDYAPGFTGYTSGYGGYGGTSMAMDHLFGTHAITIILVTIRDILSEINPSLEKCIPRCGYLL